MADLSGAADRRQELASSLQHVRDRITAACGEVGRDASDVCLVVVTKTWPASDAQLLVELGVRDLGENRDQEAVAKAAAVSQDVRWHFIGTLQRNKARSVASYAHVVHSLDRPSLVPALSAAAVRAGRCLDVLLQVSLDGDPARGGATVADVPALAEQAAAADGLALRGVAAVAPRGANPRQAFEQLAQVAERLHRAHPDATVISAGMSNDLEDAIAAGATHVRVGTAVLGARTPFLR